MPLIPEDVRLILENAIITAKLAQPDVAPGLAKTLAPMMTDGLNAVLGNDPLSEESRLPIAVPISDAFRVRDGVATILAGLDDEVVPALAAERLLQAGVVDVAAVLRSTEPAPTTGLVRTVTGAVSVGTGNLPTSTS